MSIDPKHLYPFILERSLAGYPTTNWDQKLSKICPRPPRECSGSKPYELKDDGGEDYTIDGVFNAITPRDENNLKLHFPEDRDWATLARQTEEKKCKKNYVYVGHGTGYNGKDKWGLPFSRHFMKLRWVGQWLDNGDGTADKADYCVEIGHWEKQTGLNYFEVTEKTEKENKMQNIQVKVVPGIVEVVRKLAEAKGIEYSYVDSWDYITLIPSFPIIIGDNNEHWNYSEGRAKTVSLGEFITALESLPDKEKEVELDIGFGGYKIRLVQEGVEFLGEYVVPFADFDKIVAAVGEFKSKDS